VGVVLVVEWLLFSWFGPGLLMSLLLILLGVVALVGWPLAMAITGTLNARMYPIADLTTDDEEALAKLEADLETVECDQGLSQLRRLRQKRDNLAEVLGRRLNAGELTYGRYLGTAQGVYQASIDNLRETAVALQSISAIDHEYVERRLAELTEANDSEAEAIIRERTSLEDRRSMREQQMTRAAALLAQNESAMTVLDKTAGAIADAPIGQTPTDAEEAIAQLEELAARAGRYTSPT
jgi:hypothetical protein